MTKLAEEARNDLGLAYGLGPGAASQYHLARAKVLSELTVAEQLRVANLIAYAALLAPLPDMEDVMELLGVEIRAGLDLEGVFA